MEAINEHKDEPFLAVERAVRQAVKERAMYKIKLFGCGEYQEKFLI